MVIPTIHSIFSTRIYFITISRLKFAKFLEYFKNKPQAEILKSPGDIFVSSKAVNLIQLYVFNLFHSLKGKTRQEVKEKAALTTIETPQYIYSKTEMSQDVI